MKYAIGITILLAAVIGGVVFYQMQPGVPVETAEVREGTVRVYIEERAKTRLPGVHRITMPLAGRILPIDKLEGEEVTAGEVVARMDADELKTKLFEAKARYGQFVQLQQSLEKTIKASTAQRDAREKKAQWAKQEFERIQASFKKGAVNESVKDAAELTRFESAFEYLKEQFNVQAMSAIQKAVELGKQDAKSQQEQRQRDYDRAVIKSKVEGVVLKRHVSNERYMRAGEVLLEIGDLKQLEIEADVLTQQAGRIRAGRYGSPVDIESPLFGDEPISGTVWKVYPRGFTKTSSLNVEQQRVRVIIRFQEGALEKLRRHGPTLGADYRVRVRIYTDQSDNALVVPRSAVFRDANGNWQAFVVRDGRARLVKLTVGLMNDREVEVRDGVEQGDRVIIAPESNLTDGTKVDD